MSNKMLSVAVIVVAIIAIAVWFNTYGKPNFGAIVDTSTFDIFHANTSFDLGSNVFENSSGMKVNATSDRVARLNTGFCNIWAGQTTVPAAAGATVECSGATNVTALTGVTAGDKVFLSPATTSKMTAGSGIFIVGVSASSTPGSLTVNLYNASSTAFTWTGTASSSWQYWVAN